MEHPFGMKVPPALEAYYQAWLAKDAAAVAACFTPDAEFHLPDREGAMVGPGPIQAFFEAFFAENEGLEHHRSRFFTAPGQVLSVSELTLEVPMLGPGRYLVTSAQTYTFSADGRIARTRNFIDTLGAVRMTTA